MPDMTRLAPPSHRQPADISGNVVTHLRFPPAPSGGLERAGLTGRLAVPEVLQPDEARVPPSWHGHHRRLHLAAANRTRWFVDANDDAEIGHGQVDGAHRRREDAVVEQA